MSDEMLGPWSIFCAFAAFGCIAGAAVALSMVRLDTVERKKNRAKRRQAKR